MRVLFPMVLVGICGLAAIGATRPLALAELKVTEATLTRRAENPERVYAGSAYSFRLATADEKVHHNYADLLYGNCGVLHARTVSDQANRFTDLGPGELASSPNAAPADAKWYDSGYTPTVGHVYLEEIAEGVERMTVKFRVESVTEQELRIKWVTVVPVSGQTDRARWGHAGQIGFCNTHSVDAPAGAAGPGGPGKP